jgi:hypothetical protein
LAVQFAPEEAAFPSQRQTNAHWLERWRLVDHDSMMSISPQRGQRCTDLVPSIQIAGHMRARAAAVLDLHAP